MELYLEALGVFRRVFGPEHYEVAVTLNNLAAVRAAQGDPEAAERLYRGAAAIKENVLGADSPDLAVTLNNLAVLLSGRGRFDDAAELYRRALAIFETALGPEHPHTAACRDNVAELIAGRRACCREAPSDDRPCDSLVVLEQGLRHPQRARRREWAGKSS